MRHTAKHYLFLLLIFSSLSGGLHAGQPWSLQDALGLPEWLHLSGEQRTRYETLDEQFRAPLEGSDQILAIRTSLHADADLDPFKLTAELLDSRQYLADSGSSLDTGTVNAFELLQGYLEWDFGPLGAGHHRLRLGRETLDLGSRRLIARNSFRNTINAFTGIDWHWETEAGTTLHAAWLLPNQRQPDDLSSLLDNDIAFDDQDFDLQLWTLYASVPLPLSRSHLDLYTFGLHESGNDTRHRQLYTPGFRLFRTPQTQSFDFEIESIYQLGHSSNIGGPEQRHRAHFQHLSLGYTFDLPTHPNLHLAYDYASGDHSPGDGTDNRFDTLYGARRFEYGPTDLYGAIARSNLSSPEIRLALKPSPTTEFTIAHRGIWLASNSDAWTSAGVRDRSGRSGNYVGQQVEAKLRWDCLPKNLRLELGIAHLFPGSYLEKAPQAHSADSTFSYLEMTWFF